MTTAKLFDHLRRELDLPQAILAHRLGISQGAFSKIEKGKMKPNLETFRKAYRLARAQGGFIQRVFDEWLTGESAE